MREGLRWLGTLLYLAAGLAHAPDAQAQPSLRIGQKPDELNETILRNCADALLDRARQDGWSTDLYRDDDLKVFEGATPKDTVDVFVKVDSVTNLDQIPQTFSVLRSVAAFRGPTHVAKFLASDVYSQTLDSAMGIDPMFFGVVVAYAYGGMAQIFTRDKALVDLGDLRDRTQIPVFLGHAWYAHLHDELTLWHDATLFKADWTFAAQRDALVATAAKYTDNRFFIIMPPIVAEQIAPARLRTYVSLSMTQAVFVVFSVNGWYKLNAEVSGKLKASIRAAASSCSGQNFKAERVAVQRLQNAGSQIVPVNIENYLTASTAALDKALKSAKAKLAEASSSGEKEDADGPSSAQRAVDSAEADIALFKRIQELP